MKPHKMFVASLVIVALLLTGAKCKGSPGQRPKDKDKDNPPAITCDLAADHPHRSSSKNDHIDGKVKVVCRGSTVDKIVINARLELKRGGGGWVTLPFTPGWKEQETHTTVKPGDIKNAVAGFPCSQIQQGDMLRTNGDATATNNSKKISITIKTVPNPPAGKEVVC